MALTLPTNFKNDIQGKDTALYPVIAIDGLPLISTNNNVGTEPALPILLNVPSLKESIDIEKRNYKISSVNLDISNYPYNGKRFSELVNDSLINTKVDIYWMSPSTTGTNDAMHIYQGTIRRYEHGDEKVKIVVEDRSQATLHIELPSANLGTKDVPDKYKNKPIPMVFGNVKRSPLVVEESSMTEGSGGIGGHFSLIADKNATVTYNPEETFKLKINRGDKYVDVADTFANSAIGSDTFGDYDILEQYTYTDNKITVASTVNFEGENYNPITDNNAIVRYKAYPISMKPMLTVDNYYPGEWEGQEYAYETEISTLSEVGSETEISKTESSTDITFIWQKILYTVDTPPDAEADFGFYIRMFGVDFARIDNYSSNYMNDSMIKHEIYIKKVGESSTKYNFIKVSEDGFFQNNFEFGAGDQESGTDFFGWQDSFVNAFTWWLHAEGDWNGTVDTIGATTCDASGGIKDWYYDTYYIVGNFIESDFYANVIGRKVLTGDDPSLGSSWVVTGIPQADEIIRTIMYELDPDIAANIQLIDDYNAWRYAFTVDKKINSKKLIEGIASASPLIPRFNNMGEFKFDVIPMGGGTAVSPEDNGTIKEADVISYSFSRTPIEDVYTKVELKYHWDYAREEFDKELEIIYEGSTDKFNYISTEMLINDTLLDTDYTPAYYGLSGTDDDPHSESTLTIDDDRGKYIRAEEFPLDGVGTAERFATWLLSWHCNQHLKMKIRLPLKYMNLEIGDIIKVGDNGVFGGVKPYGIDYTMGGDRVNGQLVYNRFMIFKTNKTLEYCEIECIQLHQLSDGIETIVYDEECPGGVYNCHGTCDDTWFLDACDNCVEALDYDICPEDCLGVQNGTAVYDCSGVCDGDAVIDECGVCNGDGKVPDDFGTLCCENEIVCGCLYNYDHCCACVCGGCEVTDCNGIPNGGSVQCIDGSCQPPSDCPEPDLDPISVPGSDVSAVPGDLIVLDGSNSYDPIPSAIITKYTWLLDTFLTNTSGNPLQELDVQNWNSDDWNTGYSEVTWRDFTFIAPSISDDWQYCEGNHPDYCVFQITLQVEDNEGNVADNSLNLTVYREQEDVPTVVADAGSDQTWISYFIGFEQDEDRIYLDGSNSHTTDENAWLIAWQWTQIGGIDVEILPDHESDTVSTDYVVEFPPTYFIAPVVGDDPIVLTFKLNVYDNNFNAAEDEVTITILPCPFRGDINFDGVYNVLDIVSLANCVLANNCDELDYGCAGNMNQDDGYNVLDIVSLANCILQGTCGD